MQNTYDAIVIGSGIGGLAAALLMAHAGKKVLVLEKGERYGGRLSSYERDGFLVDVGVHIISRTNKGPMGQVLKMAEVDNPLQFHRIRPVTSFNGRQFKFPYDLQQMVPQEDYDALMRFLADCRAMTDEQTHQYDDISLKEVLFRYTTNTMVLACVSKTNSTYVCLPAWETSAGEFMRCLKWEAAEKASGYPEGGCVAITNVFLDGIVKYGGQLRNHADVEKILIENGRAVGVVVNGEAIFADKIVSNLDLAATVFDLVGREHFPEDYCEYVKGLKYSWFGGVMKIALDEKITDIKFLSQFGMEDQEAYEQMLLDGILPPELNMFVVVPSNFSPAVAPEGMQILNASTAMPVNVPPSIMEGYQEAMLRTLEKYIPELRQHILWIDYMDLEAMTKELGERGASIGVGQWPGQAGSSRPKSKLPVEGLYVVGGAAGGEGVGIEMCINSAINFFEQYC